MYVGRIDCVYAGHEIILNIFLDEFARMIIAKFILLSWNIYNIIYYITAVKLFSAILWSI